MREQAGIIVERLRRVGATTFRSLISGVEIPVVVARFLAILELFRESQITLEQESPLADLYIRWVGSEQGQIEVTDEFDSDTKLSLVTDQINEEVQDGK